MQSNSAVAKLLNDFSHAGRQACRHLQNHLASLAIVSVLCKQNKHTVHMHEYECIAQDSVCSWYKGSHYYWGLVYRIYPCQKANPAGKACA